MGFKQLQCLCQGNDGSMEKKPREHDNTRERLSVTTDGDFTSLKWKFEVLVICGRDDLHSMDPWEIEEDIQWKIKINDVA